MNDWQTWSSGAASEATRVDVRLGSDVTWRPAQINSGAPARFGEAPSKSAKIAELERLVDELRAQLASLLAPPAVATDGEQDAQLSVPAIYAARRKVAQ